MGFFSWKTQDTRKSIANRHSLRGTFPVYMVDNKGNEWEELDYNGYGEFGGKDFYELLAEMNGLKTRDEGIDLWFSNEPHVSPNLYSKSGKCWKDKKPEDCKYQGFFY